MQHVTLRVTCYMDVPKTVLFGAIVNVCEFGEDAAGSVVSGGKQQLD